MDKAYALMLTTFLLGVAAGTVLPKSRLAVIIPLLLPVGMTVTPILRDPQPGEALLFVSPFLVAIAIIYGFISFGGVAVGRSLRNHLAKKQSG